MSYSAKAGASSSGVPNNVPSTGQQQQQQQQQIRVSTDNTGTQFVNTITPTGATNSSHQQQYLQQQQQQQLANSIHLSSSGGSNSSGGASTSNMTPSNLQQFQFQQQQFATLQQTALLLQQQQFLLQQQAAQQQHQQQQNTNSATNSSDTLALTRNLLAELQSRAQQQQQQQQHQSNGNANINAIQQMHQLLLQSTTSTTPGQAQGQGQTLLSLFQQAQQQMSMPFQTANLPGLTANQNVNRTANYASSTITQQNSNTLQAATKHVAASVQQRGNQMTDIKTIPTSVTISAVSAAEPTIKHPPDLTSIHTVASLQKGNMTSQQQHNTHAHKNMSLASGKSVNLAGTVLDIIPIKGGDNVSGITSNRVMTSDINNVIMNKAATDSLKTKHLLSPNQLLSIQPTVQQSTTVNNPMDMGSINIEIVPVKSPSQKIPKQPPTLSPSNKLPVTITAVTTTTTGSLHTKQSPRKNTKPTKAPIAIPCSSSSSVVAIPTTACAINTMTSTASIASSIATKPIQQNPISPTLASITQSNPNIISPITSSTTTTIPASPITAVVSSLPVATSPNTSTVPLSNSLPVTNTSPVIKTIDKAPSTCTVTVSESITTTAVIKHLNAISSTSTLPNNLPTTKDNSNSAIDTCKTMGTVLIKSTHLSSMSKKSPDKEMHGKLSSVPGANISPPKKGINSKHIGPSTSVTNTNVSKNSEESKLPAKNNVESSEPIEKNYTAINISEELKILDKDPINANESETLSETSIKSSDDKSSLQTDEQESHKDRSTLSKTVEKLSSTLSTSKTVTAIAPMTEAQIKQKRHRYKTIPYQSPIPEVEFVTKLSVTESKRSPLKNFADRLVLFYKGEFLAVRNADRGFFLCQTLHNVYKSSPRIRIRWLSEQKQSNDIYVPDFYDITDLECVLTSLDLGKANKTNYRLSEKERSRIENILKKAIDVETGVLPRPNVTEENPDGLDLSLYKDESQIEKRSPSSTSLKRKTRSPLRDNSKKSHFMAQLTGTGTKRKISNYSKKENSDDEDYSPTKRKMAKPKASVANDTSATTSSHFKSKNTSTRRNNTSTMTTNSNNNTNSRKNSKTNQINQTNQRRRDRISFDDDSDDNKPLITKVSPNKQQVSPKAVANKSIKKTKNENSKKNSRSQEELLATHGKSKSKRNKSSIIVSSTTSPPSDLPSTSAASTRRTRKSKRN